MNPLRRASTSTESDKQISDGPIFPPYAQYPPFQNPQFQQYRSNPETPSPPLLLSSQNIFFPPPPPPPPALARPWSCPRSPNQPMKCPVCLVPLEGGDVTSHFEEEVKQLETLRSQFDDWQSKENNLSDVDDIKKEMHDIPEDSFKRSKMHSDKIPPCTRWQTYQRVKQNRHTRISGMLRTKS